MPERRTISRLMRAPLHFVLAGSLIASAIGCRHVRPNKAEERAKVSDRQAKEESSRTEVELVGVLRKPRSSKSADRLEIYPVGNLKVIELLGEQLKSIPDNTPVRVRGVVRSQVVGPAKDDPDPWPIQWGVWLRVSKVQTFASVEEAFREPREQHLRERDR